MTNGGAKWSRIGSAEKRRKDFYHRVREHTEKIEI